jgi:hypothetical protein
VSGIGLRNVNRFNAARVLANDIQKNYITDDDSRKVLDFLREADGWGRTKGFV